MSEETINRYCENCGAKNESNAEVCPYCGYINKKYNHKITNVSDKDYPNISSIISSKDNKIESTFIDTDTNTNFINNNQINNSKAVDDFFNVSSDKIKDENDKSDDNQTDYSLFHSTYDSRKSDNNEFKEKDKNGKVVTMDESNLLKIILCSVFIPFYGLFNFLRSSKKFSKNSILSLVFSTHWNLLILCAFFYLYFLSD